MSLDLDLIYSQFNFKVANLNKRKIYEFEKFRLDTVHLMLYHNDEEIPLAPKAVETLLVLVEQRGEILSKDELMETIWTDSVVEESNLAQYLHLLRKTLGKTKDGKPFIETFRRRGYRFNGVVNISDFSSEIKQENTNQNFALLHASRDNGAIREATSGKVVALADWRHEPEADEKSPQEILPIAETFPAIERKKILGLVSGETLDATSSAEYLIGKIKSRKRGFAVGLTILLLASIGFGYWFFANRSSNVAAIESIAVLPFENASGDANLDYLSDGLSESLIDRLSELPQLKVIARSSSFKYRGQNIDLQDAARKLGVQAIVTGKVARRGDDLSIRVEMVDARENKHLWGEQFDRKTTDLQAAQAEVARIVSEKLRLRLTGIQEQQLTKRATENAEAYRLYLTGVFHARKGNMESYKKALDYYNQAVALDTNFALAFASMPAIYFNLAATSGLEPKEALAKAKAAAQRALELDETLAEAHSGLASIKRQEWDWSGAESEYKRAIELNPNLAGVHSAYALHLTGMGRTAEALAENKRAQELDPLRITFKANEGGILFSARRYDEAVQVFQNVLKMQPDNAFPHLGLGHTYAAKGMYAEAINEYQTVVSLNGETTDSLIDTGYAYAMSGKRAEALAILNKLKTSKEYVSPGGLTTLYAALGDKEAAFESLERAYSARDIRLLSLKFDPHYDSLRSDPRFQDLLRRVGLPQ